MNAAKLATAISEAERFLERAKTMACTKTRTYGTESHHIDNPKESGAVKRASMDLTRALADLRKYN